MLKAIKSIVVANQYSLPDSTALFLLDIFPFKQNVPSMPSNNKKKSTVYFRLQTTAVKKKKNYN